MTYGSRMQEERRLAMEVRLWAAGCFKANLLEILGRLCDSTMKKNKAYPAVQYFTHGKAFVYKQL
jgi:hypothetical protein